MTAATLAVVVGAYALWPAFRSGSAPSSATALNASSSILPKGERPDVFSSRAIGRALDPKERPQIANTVIADLDQDGLADVLVCDILRNQVSWIRQFPRDVYQEIPIGPAIPAPAHVQAIDIDDDGDLDLVVASLGVLFPSNARIGSVVVLENDGQQHFTVHIVADRLARVADARAGDLDGDGDRDLAVAGFGYDDGETMWLENRGGWRATSVRGSSAKPCRTWLRSTMSRDA